MSNCKMATSLSVFIWLLFAVTHLVLLTQAANVALWKPVEANKTCGSPAEEYYPVSQRQESPRDRKSFTCNALITSESHNATNLVDGNFSSWWQSSASVDKASITIDLGQREKFYYAYRVVIRFGEYYRPGQLAFYKSSDYGQTYEAWHYFVSDGDECQEKFGVPFQSNPVRVKQVLCMVYPTESVESNDNEWMNITNIKLEFRSLRRIFDVLAVKWHHYAVREVEVDAYCTCNGQGDGSQCFFNKTLGEDVCVCQEGACGIDCGVCCPAYNQYEWKQGNNPLLADPSAACERCNCHNHSDVCVYNETVKQRNESLDIHGNYSGGGVCQNCQDNTEGINCEKCKMNLDNASAKTTPWEDNATCVNQDSTIYQQRIPRAVKENVEGSRCSTCKDLFFDLRAENPYGCTECACDVGGAHGPVCNKTSGQCHCKENITQQHCDSPENRFYFPTLHFISSDNSDVITSQQGNKTWTATVNIVQGVNSSGLFSLLLSYKSTLSIRTLISVESNTASVILSNCSQQCFFNLSTLFGELSLTGSVMVNVIYEASAYDFAPIKVVALPQEFYQPLLLGNSSGDFLANCSITDSNMGYGTDHQALFCRAQVFSLTVNYLGGALPCNCDATGSVNATCQKYGGQCHCKPGVTGRMCDKCIAGFYNLSSEGCSDCGCVSDDKVCDAFTGQCVCPSNTIGRTCDKCNHTFWAWNETLGCQACNCSSIGSTNLQCDLAFGNCSCQPGVQGRKCTECMNGYKNFSSQGCSLCSCNGNGSLSEVCDKSSGQCPCKNNSAGLLCDQCKNGFFYLAGSNPKGCTSCVCMGITENCTSTRQFRKQRDINLGLWRLAHTDGSDSSYRLFEVYVTDNSTPVKMIAANISANDTLYWKVSRNFSDHSLVDAYGGNLSFKLHFKELWNGTLRITHPKIVLKGVKNISIEHAFRLGSADQITTTTVMMKESYWVYTADASVVSREDFLLVLAKLQTLLISASFYSDGLGTYQTSLGDVQIATVDVMSSVDGRAYEVEHCSCGVGYSGLSCERCARGHHRVNVSSDSYLGKCQPCNCNGHTEDCDPVTGQCLNCAHNTTGFHCEVCLDGFYGNATDGTPTDCKKCPCETPRTTTCMLGFFGEPLSPGGNCSKCQCNNNSDVCDTTTGRCLNCQYNTTGFHCERCENGTWGDALTQQCQGMNCSNCEAYSYNFTSNGCTPCLCNTNGSSSLQCNDSGICHCKNNTLGEKCDLCEWGFFGLPNAECQACRCNATGAYNYTRCERTSGQCDCKPGVTGRMCDRCMIQHTNFSSNGCDRSINTTSEKLNRGMSDADTVSNLKELWPKLRTVERLVDETRELSVEFNELVESLGNNMSSTLVENNALRSRVSNELSRIQRLNNYTQSTKDNVIVLNETVSGILARLTSLKADVDSILAGINADFLLKTYSTELEQVNDTVQDVQATYAFAMSARYNVSTHKNMSIRLNNTAKEQHEILRDAESEAYNTKRRIDQVTNLIDEATILINQTKHAINQTRYYTLQSWQLLQMINRTLNDSMQNVNMAQSSYQHADGLLGGLTNGLRGLNKSLATAMSELSAANKSVMENATRHAANLTVEATERQREFNRTLSHGARAVSAIDTFDKVVELANQSLNTSLQLDNLTLVSSKLRAQVNSSEQATLELLERTQNRETNLTELRASVSLARRVFMDAVTTGKSVDDVYSIIQFRKDSLKLEAELNSTTHSVLANAHIANEFSEKSSNISGLVNAGVPELLAKVNYLTERMQLINRTAEEAARNKSKAFYNVKRANESLANVTSAVQEASKLKNLTASLQKELQRNMSALEEKLKRARESVAKIRLALNLQGKTAVQYSPTARLRNTSRYTEISVDFNATRVQGSLFYLSDGETSGAQSVALTLERGSFVKFQYDLGTGPIEITNWAVRVQPGHWYTAYATRIATYRRSTDFDSLDNIYVGGLPDGAMVNKSDRYFSGCIDNVLVNQESLNLWKPVKVDGNRSFCSRRPPAQLDVISGTTFFGIPGGHVKQKIGDFNITGESEMEFIFRTFLRTAFITSVLNGQNYVYGVYLNESKVMFYFKTSSNVSYTVQSSLNSYSDGRWYKVHVVRGLKNASLTVRPVGPSDTGAVDYNMITTSTHGYLPSYQCSC
ncbi:Laminin-like protein epi-1 [Acropora cervicornis]|uniref:Laminin-like protein epi-1 n=1 Tax=Acropora cervicornis TaxID=6130 RepID=A0AAD9UUF7_ACRCE|nr:Laminin-like protein epi-1 [Acropora cervicornis]